MSLSTPGVCGEDLKISFILNTMRPFTTTPIKGLPEVQIARSGPERDAVGPIQAKESTLPRTL